MQTLTKSLKDKIPIAFPKKKILAVDIGGTLAKTAFYIPRDDPSLHSSEY